MARQPEQVPSARGSPAGHLQKGLLGVVWGLGLTALGSLGIPGAIIAAIGLLVVVVALQATAQLVEFPRRAPLVRWARGGLLAVAGAAAVAAAIVAVAGPSGWGGYVVLVSAAFATVAVVIPSELVEAAQAVLWVALIGMGGAAIVVGVVFLWAGAVLPGAAVTGMGTAIVAMGAAALRGSAVLHKVALIGAGAAALVGGAAPLWGGAGAMGSATPFAAAVIAVGVAGIAWGVAGLWSHRTGQRRGRASEETLYAGFAQ